jgi:uncharacterized coiled-coil protein SlyX
MRHAYYDGCSEGIAEMILRLFQAKWDEVGNELEQKARLLEKRTRAIAVKDKVIEEQNRLLAESEQVIAKLRQGLQTTGSLSERMRACRQVMEGIEAELRDLEEASRAPAAEAAAQLSPAPEASDGVPAPASPTGSDPRAGTDGAEPGAQPPFDPEPVVILDVDPEPAAQTSNETEDGGNLTPAALFPA